MLQSWNPWQELEDMQRRMNRVTRGEGAVNTWAPATDVVEDEEGLYIYMDLPDVDEGSLDVSTEQSSLNVKATRHYKHTESQTVHYQGRPKGEFSRSFNIPSSFDLGKVEAAYENGVLNLLVPRSESTKPRKIEVSTNRESKTVDTDSSSDTSSDNE